jgi:hypothetical protein
MIRNLTILFLAKRLAKRWVETALKEKKYLCLIRKHSFG